MILFVQKNSIINKNSSFFMIVGLQLIIIFMKFIYLVCLYDVVMSADDKESSMLMGLEGRASFYIVKHVTHDDLKD